MYEKRALKYFFEDGRVIETDKYTIDTLGKVRYEDREDGPKIDRVANYAYIKISHNKKRHRLHIARICASTFIGQPPGITYTADHKNKKRDDNNVDNIRWLSVSGQRINQERANTRDDALIIVKEGDEMTAKEWTNVYKKKDGQSYTHVSILHFAQKKQHGFSFKEYPDLEGEEWKFVLGSENTRGRWYVSDMCRMKYVRKYAENVFSDDRLGLSANGYPKIGIHGKNELCHIVAFRTWYPELYMTMKPEDMILHEEDNKLDFRPQKLRIGTGSENGNDAHDNGKYDNTQRERQKCASYINGVLERNHNSLSDAVKYLRENGHIKACHPCILQAIDKKCKSGKSKTAYKRVWKSIN